MEGQLSGRDTFESARNAWGQQEATSMKLDAWTGEGEKRKKADDMSCGPRKKFPESIERPWRWVFRPNPNGMAEALTREHSLPPVVARILAARLDELIAPHGDKLSAVAQFLKPTLGQLHDPFLLRDMEKAVRRVSDALRRGEKIVVYGDYDCDGITATALLVRLFQFLGHEVEYFIPHRIAEGYGLNADALRKLARDGAKVVVTVDNGITACEEARIARELGIDLVITDHHRPHGELPEAVAVVNPNRPDCPYPFKHLAGVGVAWKFAHALLKALRLEADKARSFLRSTLDLVTIGTVADMAPILGENRILVRQGLDQIRTNPSNHMRVLLNIWGIEPNEVDVGRIGFRIGPRLNAAGRTEHAHQGVELFTTTRMRRVEEIAEWLDALNEKRKTLESRILAESLRFVDKYVKLDEEPVLVVSGNEWHSGVIGIVASRLSEQFYRPVIVISQDGQPARGSGRSPGAFNLHAALCATSDYLVEFGGHTNAAGLSIMAEQINRFRTAINEYAHTQLTHVDLLPHLTIDCTISPQELSMGLVEDLEQLQPHGEANPEPVLAMRPLFLAGNPIVRGNGHLAMEFQGQWGKVRGIGFGLAVLEPVLKKNRYRPVEVAFTPFINTYWGSATVELRIKDIRFADS